MCLQGRSYTCVFRKLVCWAYLVMAPLPHQIAHHWYLRGEQLPIGDTVQSESSRAVSSSLHPAASWCRKGVQAQCPARTRQSCRLTAVPAPAQAPGPRAITPRVLDFRTQDDFAYDAGNVYNPKTGTRRPASQAYSMYVVCPGVAGGGSHGAHASGGAAPHVCRPVTPRPLQSITGRLEINLQVIGHAGCSRACTWRQRSQPPVRPRGPHPATPPVCARERTHTRACERPPCTCAHVRHR